MNTSTRYLFDSSEAAAEALLIVLEDARETEKYYEFGSTSFEQVYASGLVLFGDITEVTAKLDKLIGATRYDDKFFLFDDSPTRIHGILDSRRITEDLIGR